MALDPLNAQLTRLIASLRTIQPPDGVEEWLRFEVADDAPDGDYSRAVRDLLTALGVLSPDTGQVTSPAAFYLIQSLLWSIRDGAFSAESWQGLVQDSCGGAGMRLVDMLEHNRLQCAASPTPLRVIEAVMAVIKARRNGEDVYLMQYDEKAGQFQPIGGKREVFDASAEAALTREICEELALDGLIAGKDFQLRPVIEHIRVKEVSASVHVVTAYDHSFYHLTDVRFPLVTDGLTQWITAAELAARRSRDGRPISVLLEEHRPGAMAALGYSISDNGSGGK